MRKININNPEELKQFKFGDTRRWDNPIWPSTINVDAIDWLNAHHFDYRGLIKKGLALEAPESMYKEV